MGENSGIQWTTHTFNPWEGCQRVSPGCQHCYAEARNHRWSGGDAAKVLWGTKAPRRRTSEANWRKPVKWDRSAMQANVAADLAGRARPPLPRVFCASLADVFEDRHEVSLWRVELFDLIARTPHLDWLLLTKRPEKVWSLLDQVIDNSVRVPDVTDGVDLVQAWKDGTPPPNVWLGTTVEDQQRADERIPELLKVPAAVRFLSCEPLLEHVELSLPPARALKTDPAHQFGFTIKPADTQRFEGAIDWVIIGGESGPGARPFHTDWARELVEQARAAGAAPFVKQLGENVVGAGRDQLDLIKMTDHGDIDQFPKDLQVREFPRP